MNSKLEKIKKKIFSSAGNLILKILLGLVRLIWSKWIMLVIFILFLYGPFVFIQRSINDPTLDTTTPFTNIAFAILAGISAVSFSWARAIEQDDKRLVRSIVYAGEVSFQAAIFFLMASGFRYVYLKAPTIDGVQIMFYFKYVMLWASIILFCVAILNFTIALSNLTYILRQRMQLGENLPSDFEQKK
jgi:hypothetical protein